MPPRVVRFLATDGPVEVDGVLARSKSELVRDLCDMGDGDETVFETSVPFNKEACDLIVDAWREGIQIYTGRKSSMRTRRLNYTFARSLCRALDFANWLRSDAATRVVGFRLREELERSNWCESIPKYRDVPRPRPITTELASHIQPIDTTGTISMGEIMDRKHARWEVECVDVNKLSKLELVAAEHMRRNMARYDAEIEKIDGRKRARA